MGGVIHSSNRSVIPMLGSECWCLLKIHMLESQPPNPHPVMVLGGGAGGRWLGHDGGALTDRIGALLKEIPQGFLAPSHNEKSATWKRVLTQPR